MSQTTDKVEPLWLSVAEAAKLGGVTKKTIRRAIQARSFKYRLIKNRYQIEAGSLVAFFCSSVKLKHKFNQTGLGQYVKEWQ